MYFGVLLNHTFGDKVCNLGGGEAKPILIDLGIMRPQWRSNPA
jgi:hypothetical protein